MFALQIPIIAYILVLVALAAFAFAAFYSLRPYIKAANFQNPSLPETVGETPAHCPKVSVVMYCQSDEQTLFDALEQLDRQDYPDFEVIVVCDAGVEYADYISELVAAKYKNVYVTFVQPGSHNLSRRKLANTIGIKAAKGEIVLTTWANIHLPSDKWISLMMAPFLGPDGEKIDLSLGLSKIDFSNLRGFGRWYRQFDSVMTDALWVGYAAAGHPYRGDGYNLAFRRKLFFDHKGYSRSNYLHNGDDDVFVREVARRDNTRIVVDKDCIVTSEWGDSGNRVWSLRKASYSFTSRWLPRMPFWKSGTLMAMQWIVPGASVAAALVGWPSIWPLVAGALITLGFWGLEIYEYRKLAARFGAVRLWWAVVPFMMWRPIANTIFSYDHLSSRKKNYTWQR